jgi:hypothetical protein
MLLSAIATALLLFIVPGSGAERTDHDVRRDVNSELQADLQQLDSYRVSRNLAALESAVASDSVKWQGRSRDLFIRYLEHACSLLSSYDLGNQPRQASMLNKYALSVLAGGDLALRDRVQFVEFLAQDPPVTDAAGWEKLRAEKARLWLETWKQIAGSINSKFNFNDLPMLNVAPPAGTGLPAGVAPEAIKDPKLRAEYEQAIAANASKTRIYSDQLWLRQTAPSFYKEAENYLVNAYKKAPSDLPQLEQLVSVYVSDEQARRRILESAKKQ